MFPSERSQTKDSKSMSPREISKRKIPNEESSPVQDLKRTFHSERSEANSKRTMSSEVPNPKIPHSKKCRSQSKTINGEVPNERFKAKDPKRKFPSEGSHTKTSQRSISNESSHANDPQRDLFESMHKNQKT